MPVFKYRAISGTGNTVNGEIEAPDRKGAVQRLATRGLKPVQIEQTQQTISEDVESEKIDLFHEAGAADKKRLFGNLFRSKRGLSLLFLKRLHVLLSAGMSLGDSVRLLSQRLSDPALRDLCNQVWRRLSEGRTLASSMRDFPAVFAPSTVHLVEAGEASGSLVPVIDRIVQAMEEAAEVRKNLIANLMYPAFILSMAAVIIVILMVFLIPRIEEMLDQLGGELPWITQVLVSGSEFALKFGPFILVALVFAGAGISQWRRTKTGRRQTDLWTLRMPLLGRIYLYANIFSTTNLLATLLSSGVNTTEALRLVERTITNVILKAKFAVARRQIQEGVSMAAAIAHVRFMPDLAMDILTVGENTGNVVNSLMDINRIYREELTKALGLLTGATVAIALGFAIVMVAIIAVSVVFAVLETGRTLQMSG